MDGRLLLDVPWGYFSTKWVGPPNKQHGEIWIDMDRRVFLDVPWEYFSTKWVGPPNKQHGEIWMGDCSLMFLGDISLQNG